MSFFRPVQAAESLRDGFQRGVLFEEGMNQIGGPEGTEEHSDNQQPVDPGPSPGEPDRCRTTDQPGTDSDSVWKRTRKLGQSEILGLVDRTVDDRRRVLFIAPMRMGRSSDGPVSR